MTSSTVGLIFLILYFLYLNGSNWRNLIKLGLISTLEFQTNQCLSSLFWALVVDQYCLAKITLWTLQTIYNIPMKENLSTSANTIKICGGPGLRPGGVQFFHIIKGAGKLKTTIKICGGPLCSGVSWSNSNGVECSVARILVSSTNGHTNTTAE